ncbi:MAG: hypothetical protein GXO77_02345 [Calditrichaeota bacterium]|nr:hypothetical protein [Calditrichota bacterium]
MSRFKKTSLLLTVFLLVFSVRFLAAQEKSKTPEYRHGFDFYLINGVAFAYQYRLSEKKTVRIYVDLSGGIGGQNSEGDSEYRSPSDTTKQKADSDSKSDNQSITISPHFFYQIFQRNIVKIHVGAGPIFSFSRSWSKNNSTYTKSEKSEHYSDKSSWWQIAGGLNFLAKTEANLFKTVYMFAQINTAVLYRYKKARYDSKNNNEPTTYRYERRYRTTEKGWNLGLNRIRVGLSVYF